LRRALPLLTRRAPPQLFAHLSDVVQEALAGRSVAVLAYGQTGTGKTYSMLGRETLGEGGEGAPEYALTGAARGVIPRVLEALLAGAAGEAEGGWRTAALSATYLQLYGERVYDLLQPLPVAAQPWSKAPQSDRAMAGLELRAGADGVACAAGAQSVSLESGGGAALEALLARGAAHRALRATASNGASSRSHALLTLSLRQATADGRERACRLHLVDLAGSEKWDASEPGGGGGGGGARLAELCAINASLSALGACVRALGDPGRPHVPFRDSKLTRLLAEALGGGAASAPPRTVLIATLSPSSLCFDESCQTLRFADAASRLLLAQRAGGPPGRAEEAGAAVAAARAEVARLQLLLRSMADEGEARERLQAENVRLRRELAAAQARAAAASRAAAAASAAAAGAAEAAAAREKGARRAATAAAGARRSPAQPLPAPRAASAARGAAAPLRRRPTPPTPPPPARAEAAGAEAAEAAAAPAAAASAAGAGAAEAEAEAPARLSDGWRDGPGESAPSRAGDWLAEYAARRKAASAAAALARAAAAAAGGGMLGSSRRPLPVAAWDEAPFFSKRAVAAASRSPAPRPAARRPPALARTLVFSEAATAALEAARSAYRPASGAVGGSRSTEAEALPSPTGAGARIPSFVAAASRASGGSCAGEEAEAGGEGERETLSALDEAARAPPGA